MTKPRTLTSKTQLFDEKLVLINSNPKNDFNIGSVLTTKFKELRNGYNEYQHWVSKQCFPIQDGIVTTVSAVQGAVIGAAFGLLSRCKFLNGYIHFKSFGTTPLIQARNFSVLMATDAAVSCLMKRVSDKDDVLSRMMAAFVSGYMFQVVSRGPSYDPITNGALFAAWHGILHKNGLYGLCAKVLNSSQVSVLEDGRYAETKCMLSNLGLEDYAAIFKKNHFTDKCLPFLEDSVLQEAAIPFGARLLILDYIKRFNEDEDKSSPSSM